MIENYEQSSTRTWKNEQGKEKECNTRRVREAQIILGRSKKKEVAEEWRKIDGYDYWISNFGQVKSKFRILKQCADSHGYMIVNLSCFGFPKTFSVHRIIALTFISNPNNLPKVDHIDRNILNNNITNLRWVSNSVNGMNSCLSKANTSGFCGVYWNKTHMKWVAYIKINRRRKSLGYFFNKQDAIKARELADNQYWSNLK